MRTAGDLRTVIEGFIPNIRKSKQLASDCETFCERLIDLLDGGVSLPIDEDERKLEELGVADASELIEKHKTLLDERDGLAEKLEERTSSIEELRCELDKMILYILNRPDAELRHRLGELQEFLGRDGEPLTASSFGVYARI